MKYLRICNLNPAQEMRFETFKRDCEALQDIYDEGVAPMSPFLWTYRSGSVCSEIRVYLFNTNGPMCDLSIDDDGEWVASYVKPFPYNPSA